MDAWRKTRVRVQPTPGKAVFIRALVILNFDINCHFYTRHISVQNIGYRSSWSVIIGIGPEKRISVDPNKNVSTICFWRNIVVSCYSAHSINYSFWRLRHILYNATYIHNSVNSAVELLSQDSALIRNHKVHYLHVLLNVSFAALVWRALFLSAEYTWSSSAKSCQTAPDYWTKLSFALIQNT